MDSTGNRKQVENQSMNADCKNRVQKIVANDDNYYEDFALAA